MWEPFLIVAFAALFVVPALAVRWLVTASTIRKTMVISAQPILEDTNADQIPPAMRATLTQVLPALERLGFTIAANMHSPEMARFATWTQVLFINRERGERASVMFLRPTSPDAQGRAKPTLAFGTEAPDGRSVRTKLSEPIEASVQPLYERHRRAVEAELGAADIRGVVPKPGDERQWLRDRAGRIAEVLARELNFVRDRDGLHYRPSWRGVLPLALKLIWTRKRKAGFDVLPMPPTKEEKV